MSSGPCEFRMMKHKVSRLDPGENLNHAERRPAARKTCKAASLTVMSEAIAAWNYFGRRIKNDSIGSATNSAIRGEESLSSRRIAWVGQLPISR